MFDTDRVAELPDRIGGQEKVPEFTFRLQVHGIEKDMIVDVLTVILFLLFSAVNVYGL